MCCNRHFPPSFTHSMKREKWIWFIRLSYLFQYSSQEARKKNPCCLFLVPCKKKTGQELGETLPGDAAQAANERRASVGKAEKPVSRPREDSVTGGEVTMTSKQKITGTMEQGFQDQDGMWKMVQDKDRHSKSGSHYLWAKTTEFHVGWSVSAEAGPGKLSVGFAFFFFFFFLSLAT